MFGHRLLKMAAWPGERRFAAGRERLESVQRQKQAALLKRVAASPLGHRNGIRGDWSWEAFADRQPVTDYEQWADAITLSREHGDCRLIDSPLVRCQPTSGSTSAIKWIPYTRQFLGELDAAISPWIVDLYRQYPRLVQGRHYWSMSWVPTSLRDNMREDVNDDIQLMSMGKRLLAGATQCVPQDVALARTSDDSLFATLAYLVSDPALSMLSIWSPTFGLGMLRAMAQWREELAEVLNSGSWGNRMLGGAVDSCPWSPQAAALLREWDGRLNAEFLMALWPKLALVSAWDTAASTPWAKELHALLPQAAFQGKGLWATEGVVTIPYAGRYPLAYRSHVYEFQDPTDGRIFAPWELEAGQQVMPLLSTGSGLLRYRLKDLVEVDDFVGGIPSLRFLGRAGTTDLVGEKMTAAAVDGAMAALALPEELLPVCTVAVDQSAQGLPGYVLLLEGENPAVAQHIAVQMESALQLHFHYQLARNLGQLAPLRCVIHPGMRERYLQHCRQRGMIEGNIKMESLQYWAGRVPTWLEARSAQTEAPGVTV